jgi:hypothetical protein
VNLEALGDTERELAPFIVSPDSDRSGMQGSLDAKQLVYAGLKRPDSFYLSRSTVDAVDDLFCEIIVSEAELPVAGADRFLFACAIPPSFLEEAVELWASVDGQMSLLSRADQVASVEVEESGTTETIEKPSSSQTEYDVAPAGQGLGPDAKAELFDRLNAKMQELFDERWRSMQAQIAMAAPVLGPDAMADVLNQVNAAVREIFDERWRSMQAQGATATQVLGPDTTAVVVHRVNSVVRELFDERWRALQVQVEASLGDITGFKNQIPRLLNAVSAATAAASVVGKGIKNMPNSNVAVADAASEIRELRREIQMLRSTVHSILTNSQYPKTAPEDSELRLESSREREFLLSSSKSTESHALPSRRGVP